MSVLNSPQLEKKEQNLKEYFSQQSSVLIAFSGGADSSLLASVAAETPGLKSMAVTIMSPLVPQREIEIAKKIAADIGITLRIIEKRMLDLKGIRKNELNRCYVCKKEVMETLSQIARTQGFDTILEGTNYSDVTGNVSRPGYNAIMDLNNKPGFDIRMPFVDLEITKSDILKISKKRSTLPADKPPMSCLATRFSYGTVLTPELLQTVDDAEQMMTKAGFSQIRIRCHTDQEHRKFARIELDKDEMGKLFDCKAGELSKDSKIQPVIRFLKEKGFSYVTLDLEGFRSGSMDL
ncbi:ATP-dependent sacrificial sulfur transferase LarE [Methanolapillus ohkumae]